VRHEPSSPPAASFRPIRAGRDVFVRGSQERHLRPAAGFNLFQRLSSRVSRLPTPSRPILPRNEEEGMTYRTSLKCTRVWPAAALLTTVLAAATCSGPTAPGRVPSPNAGPPPPPPTIPSITISGVVTGDGKPLENAGIDLRGNGGLGRATTDATGRYSVKILGIPSLIMVNAHHDAFPYQPCASNTVYPSGSTEEELVVDVALTALKGEPRTTPAPIDGRRMVTGTVYSQQTNKPAAEVFVGWSAANDDLRAWTETDTRGRFLLCGLSKENRLFITAETAESAAAVWVEPGGDAEIELELKRY
jgi:hypothetical protein